MLEDGVPEHSWRATTGTRRVPQLAMEYMLSVNIEVGRATGLAPRWEMLEC